MQINHELEAVVAAVLYTVCRTYHVPRTLNEMAEASGLTKKEIGRTYRFLVRELNLAVPLTNPIHYIPRFASELNLSGEVQEGDHRGGGGTAGRGYYPPVRRDQDYRSRRPGPRGVHSAAPVDG